ncbi:MAG: DEAD/DEAH box helicase, partial [Sulfuricurvum sp.]|nr:DEAD/DEAH box helicase [Sulfuricurvum sp.]
MATLPIHDVIEELQTLLKSNNRLILQAPPGAGKTTVVPLSLLDEPWLGGKQIIMLEPRRIAARSAAARMAQLLGEKAGERVGYQIRAEKKLSEQTKILVVTEGILTRMLQRDPSLENVALILFDEFHERHLHSDLSLAFALQSQEFLREDLKILVMSATLDTDALQTLLNHPPLITSEGRSFPITIEHLPPNSPSIEAKKIVPALMGILKDILVRDEGSILVFLPGTREIKTLEASLREHCSPMEIDIAP